MNNMKTKFVRLLILLMGVIVSTEAQVVQTMILKNGSELDGYIAMQRPGENFSFAAQRAQIFMSGKDVQSIVEKEVNIRDLSDAWKRWADENDAFVGIGDNRILVLSDIVTYDGTIGMVRVLEKGAKVKYLDLSAHSYSLNWDTIEVVKAPKRARSLLTGINRVYKLSSGVEHEGQYVEEVPDKTLSLYRDNGVVEVFETKSVVKDMRRKVNPNQSITEQSELLDVVQLKDGGQLKGIIFERNYVGESAAGNYLLIQLQNQTTQSIKLDDVAEYRREPNPNYDPVYDILLREGEIVINREEVVRQTATERNSLICIAADSCKTVIAKTAPETQIVLEAHFNSELMSQYIKLIKVTQLADKKKKSSCYGFTFEDLVKSAIPPTDIVTSINNTTKIVYMVKDAGLYTIYDPQTKMAIPLRIE